MAGGIPDIGDMPATALRVLLIEDHTDFREGLSHLIKCTAGFALAGSFPSVEDAERGLPAEVDVILLDIHLPGRSGIEAIASLRSRLPEARIIMITVFDDDENIFNAILSGADGYILKKTPPAQILQAVVDARDGGTPMTPYVARKVVEYFKKASAPASHDLTAREVEVLQALSRGLDTQEIADTLFIATDTVRNHLKHIYAKLHVRSRSQAVAFAIKNRLA